MPSAPLSPEKQAEIEDLSRAIHEAVEAEIDELAAHLATTDDAHLFGSNEFTIRALARSRTSCASTPGSAQPHGPTACPRLDLALAAGGHHQRDIDHEDCACNHSADYRRRPGEHAAFRRGSAS